MASIYIDNLPRTPGLESVKSILYRETMPGLVAKQAASYGIRTNSRTVIDTALGIYGTDDLLSLPTDWPTGVLDHIVSERNIRCFDHMVPDEAPESCHHCKEPLHDEQFPAGVTSQCTIRVCGDPECANNRIICLS